MTHPGGQAHGGGGRGPAAPSRPHPLVRAAVPRSRSALSVLLAWAMATALTVALVALGRTVDALAVGADPAPALIAFAAGILATAAASGADAVHTARAQAEAESALRTQVIAAVFDAGAIAASTRSGALLSLATDSVERAARYRAAFLGPIIGSFTTPLLVLAVYAVTLDPVVASVLAAMLVVVPLVIGLAQRAVRRSGGESRRERARLTAAFLTSVQGLSTLVAARAAGRAATHLAAQGERHRRGLMGILARNQILILVIDLSVSLGVVLVALLLAATRVGEGVMTLGSALATVLISLVVIRPVDAVGQFFYIGIAGRAAEGALGAHFTAADRAAEAAGTTLDHAPEVEPDPGAPASPAIELRDVTAGWAPGRPVLRDLDLQIAHGEHVALVGPSGVGKSTVAALVQAHLLPERGEVRVVGVATSAATAPAVRRRLAVVAQRTFLFQGTIADNLRLAALAADEGRMWRALDAAGLGDDVRAMPAALDTLVGEHGLTLSGGQSQRVAVARAMLRDAPILVLDEPTSQVDLAGEAAFLEALDRLADGRTVLMIAHRPGAVLAADRTVELRRGGGTARTGEVSG